MCQYFTAEMEQYSPHMVVTVIVYLRAFLLITHRKSGNVEWKNCNPIACCSNHMIAMIQTDRQTDGQMERRMDGQTNESLTYFGATSSPSGHSCLIISQNVVTTPFNLVRKAALFLPLRALPHITNHLSNNNTYTQ